MKRIAKTLVITWLYGVAWILLEWLIYHEITERMVDNIMLVLFGVIVYWLIGREQR